MNRDILMAGPVENMTIHELTTAVIELRAELRARQNAPISLYQGDIFKHIRSGVEFCCIAPDPHTVMRRF